MAEKRIRHELRFQYSNRRERATFTGLVFQDYLQGAVLDVGASGGNLRKYVTGMYVSADIATSGDVNVKIDLDRNALPFPDLAFDTVVCTEVLEHIDRLHDAFDELCRVSRDVVLVSLPNTRNIETALRILSARDFKFYGLPVDPPQDRHRWFFGYREAAKFIGARAERNGFRVSTVFPQLLMRGRMSRTVCKIGEMLLPLDLFHEYFSVSCWALLHRTNPATRSAK